MMEREYLSFIVIFIPPFACFHNSKNIGLGFITQVFLPAKQSPRQCRQRCVKPWSPAVCQKTADHRALLDTSLRPLPRYFIAV